MLKTLDLRSILQKVEYLIEDYLPEERLDVKIKVVDEDTRILIFKPHGIKYEELCEAIL